MDDPLNVPAGERGVVRVFALGMRPEQARFLREPGAAAQVFGVDALDPAQVDIFAVADLEDLGLDGYLAEGCGIPDAAIAADRDRLRAQEGWVMVLRSRAFSGRAASLEPAASLSLIGTYAERPTDWTGGPLTAASARPGSGPRQSPRAARSRARRIGFSMFAAGMALIFLVLYLVAT